MKKYYLFFVTLLYASIGLSIRSAELPERRIKRNFSLKNGDKSKESIYFMAVNGKELTEGFLRPGDSANYFFNADDFSNILGVTRLYIWEGNTQKHRSSAVLENLSPTVLKNLRQTVLESQFLAINQIDFFYRPDWFFIFPPGKVIHVKWKKRELLPREGKQKKKSGHKVRYTQEGFVLINNVTEGDMNDKTWVFDAKKGRWLDRDAIFKENFADSFGTGL